MAILQMVKLALVDTRFWTDNHKDTKPRIYRLQVHDFYHKGAGGYV